MKEKKKVKEKKRQDGMWLVAVYRDGMTISARVLGRRKNTSKRDPAEGG